MNNFKNAFFIAKKLYLIPTHLWAKRVTMVTHEMYTKWKNNFFRVEYIHMDVKKNTWIAVLIFLHTAFQCSSLASVVFLLIIYKQRAMYLS